MKIEWRVRPGTDDDVKVVAPIVQRSFPWGMTTEQIEERLRTDVRWSRSFVVAEGRSGVVGCLADIPFRAYFRGREFDVSGIAVVSVDTCARRLGVAAAMLSWSLRRARRRGVRLGMLFPFRHDFYENYGYGLASAAVNVKLRPSAFPAFEERSMVRAFADSDLAAIMRLHEGTRHGVDFRFARSEDCWRKHVFSPRSIGHAVVVEEPSGVTGYVLYALERKTAADRMRVGEVLFTTPVACRAIMGFFAAQGDQLKWVSLTVSDGHPLRYLALDPSDAEPDETVIAGSFFGGRVMLGPMLRVIDTTALDGLRVNDVRVSFDLALDDRQLPANRRRIGVSASGGVLKVRTPGAGPLLSVDPQTFSKIVSGRIKTTDAVTWGAARVERRLAERLDELFADPPPDGFLALDGF